MNPDLDWQRRYETRDTPWDKGVPAPFVRLLLAALSFFTISGCLMGAPTAPVRAWSTIWLPWYEVYPSWNWRQLQCPVAIQRSGSDPSFPDSIKKWNLDVCSITAPSHQAFASLPSPAPGEAYSNTWTPGDFPVTSLEALGEGTFLCAVVGDGHRYSNVSRVTIRHSASIVLPPQMRLIGLSSPHGDIREIGLFVVPAQVPVPQIIHLMDVTFPNLSVNGTWSKANFMSWSGPNSVLRAGEGWGAILPLDNYTPAIKPFRTARVQVRMTNALEDGRARLEKQLGVTLPANASPEYVSPPVILSINRDDEREFDRAFDVSPP